MLMSDVRIEFHGVENSDALNSAIQECYDRLTAHCEKVMGAHVVVESPHRHHEKGRSIHVRVDVKVPGTMLVAQAEAEEDAYYAARLAFQTAERRVRDWEGKKRSHRHESPPVMAE